MAHRRITNPLALAVLVLLWEKPMHPYEMSRTLRERGKEKNIKLNYGSLYSVVEQLQRNGLVTDVETVRDGRRPERTVYAATTDGLDLMEEWMAELLSTPIAEFPQFEAALSLMAALPPDHVADLLERRVVLLRLEAGSIRSGLQLVEEQVPRLFLVEEEYHLAMLEAEIAWVEVLVKQIRTGELEGVEGWREIHQRPR